MNFSQRLLLFAIERGELGYRLIDRLLSNYNIDEATETGGDEATIRFVYESLLGELGLFLALKTIQKKGEASQLSFMEHQELEEALLSTFMKKEKGEYEVQKAIRQIKGKEYFVLDYRRLTVIKVNERIFLIEQDPDRGRTIVHVVPTAK